MPLVPHLRMTLAKLDAVDAAICDRLGGAPNQWVEAEPWPACGYCQQPMQFAVQLRGTTAGGQAEIGAAWLQLFVCHSGEDCGFYDLRSRSHHVALRAQPLLGSLASRPAGHTPIDKRDPLRLARRIELVAGADDPDALDDYENDARRKVAHTAGFVDKLYGVPVAANQPEAVTCSQCAEPLRFLGQLLSADDWFIYYLQHCASGHEVTFHAQRA